MTRNKHLISDEKMDEMISLLLRTGVAISSLTVFFGGVIYLMKHGRELPGYHIFAGEPARFRSVLGVTRTATSFSGRGIIQLGLLLLIATPVMRVVFTVFSFLLQKDRVYAGIALIVLLVLLFSLAGGR